MSRQRVKGVQLRVKVVVVHKRDEVLVHRLDETGPHVVGAGIVMSDSLRRNEGITGVSRLVSQFHECGHGRHDLSRRSGRRHECEAQVSVRERLGRRFLLIAQIIHPLVQEGPDRILVRPREDGRREQVALVHIQHDH